MFEGTVRRSARETPPEPALHAAFKDAYAAFGTAQCWEYAPDVVHAIDVLQTWRESYGPTAVLSNFDERLPSLLRDMKLAHLFDVIRTSRELGVEKPDVAAFEAVRNDPRIALPASQSIHIGDNLKKDLLGATAAGWRAIGVGLPPTDGHLIIPSLAQLSFATMVMLS